MDSHKELRCPECRVLVEVRVEELPPNVLLMRILEGMRNSAPRKPTLVGQRGPRSGHSHQVLSNLIMAHSYNDESCFFTYRFFYDDTAIWIPVFTRTTRTIRVILMIRHLSSKSTNRRPVNGPSVFFYCNPAIWLNLVLRLSEQLFVLWIGSKEVNFLFSLPPAAFLFYNVHGPTWC